MPINNHKKSGMVPIIISCCLFIYSFESNACKRTAEAGEKAFRSAVLREIKNQKDLDGFKVVGKIHHQLNIYKMHLKNGPAKRSATFEVVGQADCQVTAKRLPEE